MTVEVIHKYYETVFDSKKMHKWLGVMIKLIGLPNCSNFRYIFTQFRFNKKLGRDISKEMLSHYDKGMNHINAWDSFHFITLLASCGFEMLDYLPTEGVAIPMFEFHSKKMGYLDKENKGIFKNLCYTMHYVFQKVKFVDIGNFD